MSAVQPAETQIDLTTEALPQKRGSDWGSEPRPLKPVETGKSVRTQRSPVFLAFTAVGMVLAILAVKLWLSIMIGQGAYEANALLVEQRTLDRNQQALQHDVDLLASPQFLAEQALGLGMVQNARPAYLELGTSQVHGNLEQTSSTPLANLVPNAALAGPSVAAEPRTEPRTEPRAEMPTSVDAQAAAALEAVRSTTATTAPEPVRPTEPLPWQGRLPAPQTR